MLALVLERQQSVILVSDVSVVYLSSSLLVWYSPHPEENGSLVYLPFVQDNSFTAYVCGVASVITIKKKKKKEKNLQETPACYKAQADYFIGLIASFQYTSFLKLCLNRLIAQSQIWISK